MTKEEVIDFIWRAGYIMVDRCITKKEINETYAELEGVVAWVERLAQSVQK
jgi:hypothetical protein